jgi:hypothetical protein
VLPRPSDTGNWNHSSIEQHTPEDNTLAALHRKGLRVHQPAAPQGSETTEDSMGTFQDPLQALAQVSRQSAYVGSAPLPAYLRDWEPGVDLDSDRALPARVDHQMLGGKDGFRADRTAAKELTTAVPEFAEAVRARRRFVERALRHLVRGDQVLDLLILGSGLPLLPHLHEVVQAEVPQARVVYVDQDPIVLSHLRAELNYPPPGGLAVTRGHLRDPQQLLGSNAVSSLLAAGRPVAVVLESVLEYIPDEEDPRRLVIELMEGLPKGSWFVLSHATSDLDPAMWQRITAIYASHGIAIFPRSLEQVAAFLDGMLLTVPGLVEVNQWCPDAEAPVKSSDAAISRYGAVGRLGRSSARGGR